MLLSFLLLTAVLWLVFSFMAKAPIPILMYHRIAAIRGDRNCLPPDKFDWQLYYLKTHGYTTITLPILLEYYRSGRPLPTKPVLLTFDDGYRDNFTTALPLLQKYDMSAVVFVIGNWIGKKNDWENLGKSAATTMTLDDLRAWQENGMEIASHTMDHPFLNVCDEKRQLQELANSKKLLEETFHKPVDFVCYPYGKFNATTVAMAKKAGYEGAFAIFEHVPLWKTDRFALPRVPIPSNQKKWEFKLKIGPLFPLFIALRQAERYFKKCIKK